MAVNAFEKKRVEELFKYFQAASYAIGLANNNVDLEHQYDPTLGRVSLDPVLNALCQLGVHRLNCDRAFISLIDHENQYIISEMTKSVSLYDTSRHDAGDAICMGARPLDLFAGVCAGTMPAFTGGPAPNPYHVNTPNMFADETRYIINDFSLEPKYKDRPYVKGHPHMRYYVEVPIKTSSGYVIGSYAVVDNKPGDGLDERNFLVLNDISASIMRHIEMIKIQDDYAQSSRLLQGLDSLVQDSRRQTTLENSNAINGAASRRRAGPVDGHAPQTTRALGLNNLDPTSIIGKPQRDPLTSGSRSATATQPQSNTADLLQTKTPCSTRSNSPAPPVSDFMLDGAKKKKLDDVETVTQLRDFHMSADVRGDFGVAAESLRVAMDLDSVMFLDALPFQMTSQNRTCLASSKTAQKSPQNTQSGGPTNVSYLDHAPSIFSATQDVRDLPLPSTQAKATATQQMCSKLLGASTKVARHNAENNIPPVACEVSESLHQNLLSQYPQGCVFNLGFGYVPGDTSTVHPTSKPAETDFRHVHQVLSHQKTLDEIHFTFPLAKSVIFLPLWNAPKRNWFAGCLGWSSHEKRILGYDDLAYCNIFGNTLMARAARLDLIATDQAKSDFISNISHELRSPLHGILGSTELLREVVQDADQQQMIAMVEQCGRTLLDTMNHVLDYSKITGTGHEKESQDVTEMLTSTAEPNSYLKNLSIFDLSALVEEVVESLVAGHQHSSGSQTEAYHPIIKGDPFLSHTREGKHLRQSPTVILDIDHRDTWFIKSDAASWRRCVLNLLGNALKYTDAGFIEVVVRCSVENTNTTGTVTLLLRDTGRGIGKVYLENHLFRPFVQEDPLSSGTGLGLSIVKSLVQTMGGWIEVQSEVGIGTQVEVSVPVNFVSTAVEMGQMLHPEHPKFTACFPEFEIFPSEEERGSSSTSQNRSLALKRAVSTHLGDWLKMNISSSTMRSHSVADLIVVEEDNLHLFHGGSSNKTPEFRLPSSSVLLVLCTQHKMQHHTMHSTTDPVYYVSQPFGPRRLASLISRLSLPRNGEDLMQPTDMKSLGGRAPDVSPAHITMTISSGPQKTDPTNYTAESLAMNRPGIAAPLSVLHILLVDDNDINLALLVRCMQQQQINYRAASNGAEALEAYKVADPPFDCVFMDISMPVMDGFAATRAIRDFERSSGRAAAQVIAMTGLGNAKARQEGLSSGMDEYLIKPVRLQKVRSLIQEMSRMSAVPG